MGPGVPQTASGAQEAQNQGQKLRQRQEEPRQSEDPGYRGRRDNGSLLVQGVNALQQDEVKGQTGQKLGRHKAGKDRGPVLAEGHDAQIELEQDQDRLETGQDPEEKKRRLDRRRHAAPPFPGDTVR